MKISKRERDILDHIEEFFEKKVEKHLKKGVGKVEKHVKNGVGKIEKLLKKEIRLIPNRKGKEKRAILKYDPDSPFSYLSAFLRDKAVASVAPSSKFVVNRVIKAMNLSKAKVVVEYGPAEGVITRKILQQVPRDAVVVAIETNENFVRTLKAIPDSRLKVVHGDVQDVDKILKRLGLKKMDAATSGIPFSYFNPRERHLLLEKTMKALSPKGRFVPYQFTTHLIPLLKCYFRDVDIQFEVRNLPPFFVFTCFK
ncbi:MAG: rRNA adenine N-6-methyltransferase family protein [Elusimicrobiota bacterium]